MKKSAISRYSILVAVMFFVGTLFPYAYAAAESSLKKLRTLVDVIEFVKENYVEQTDTDTLIAGAIKGVVGELDAYSQYLDAADYKTLKNETKGEFGGIGCRLQKKGKFITVSSPLPNTPAYEAKIMPEDRILAVDDKDIKGMNLEDAVALMRGKVGSKVKLTISRKNEKGEYKTQDIVLKRATIVPEVVYFRMIPNKIGYVYLVDFSGHSTEELQKALEKLTKQGMKSLVLDLRFNPGGLLPSAVDISKLFLKDGEMIVFTQGRKEEYYKEYKTSGTPKYPDLPLVVLVNQFSASASEIVSGALQDNHRATIIGNRTYGKASVQQLMPLSGGAGLKLTIAKYYTPAGKLIQRNYRDKDKADEGGIWPDVEVFASAEAEAKIFKQYNELIYTPGKKDPEFKNTEKDPVLDKAVAILTGEISLEDAKAQAEKEAQERKEKEKSSEEKEETDEKEAQKEGSK